MTNSSPFHQGEQAIQEKVGVRTQMEQFGRQVIRSYMPDQHRDFYQNLPYIILGYRDPQGELWASIIWAGTGFIESPDPQTLIIDNNLIAGDVLKQSLQPGAGIGLLGIDLSNRRRNRLSTEILETTNQQSFKLGVRQSFGNCPQYIQQRELQHHPVARSNEVIVSRELSESAKAIINQADTFFVSSYYDELDQLQRSGADVSHRGGKPGFILIENNRDLLIPDFPGNFHFNTFGNFLKNPKAGLLFVDFASGDVLQLSGEVEILWEHELLPHFDNAERFWRFKVEQARHLPQRLCSDKDVVEYSPNSLLSGDWGVAKNRAAALKERAQWKEKRVTAYTVESDDVVSIELEGENLGFTPGQHINISLNNPEDNTGGEGFAVRSYSLSGSSADQNYRISVKRDGRVSQQIHEHIKLGDSIYTQSPNGLFTFDSQSQNPALLICAGVGVTPMVSMAHQLILDLSRKRYARSVALIAITKNKNTAAFYDELTELAAQSRGRLSIHWFFTELDVEVPNAAANNYSETEIVSDEGMVVNHRPKLENIKDVLNSLNNTHEVSLGGKLLNEVFLCGPEGFMQETYDMLRVLDVEDKDIYAETFGPSSLHRKNESIEVDNIADEAQINVIDGQGQKAIEQLWRKEDGSLLEFMLKHGFSAPYSCRSGRCGACRCKKSGGDVVQYPESQFPIEANEILPCTAFPGEAAEITLDYRK